ncbi:MAG: hypothetical protein ABIH26_08015 [Candidatus Eisenbacteria bacterium]
MTRRQIVLLAAVFLVLSCGAKTETREELSEDGKTKVRWEEKQSRFGDWVRHGKYAEWDTNGTKRVEGRYADGQPHGRWIRYSPSGSREEETRYERGVFQGEYVQWFADTGVMKRRVRFLDGRMHGRYEERHPNGETAQYGEFVEGRPAGPFTQYYPTGEKRRRGEYGEPFKEEGEWVTWNMDGSESDRWLWKSGRPVTRLR